MKFKVGDIVEVKNRDGCGQFINLHDQGAKYIQITEVMDSYYRYEILDKRRETIGKCSVCLKDGDLMPRVIRRGATVELEKRARFILLYGNAYEYGTDDKQLRARIAQIAPNLSQGGDVVIHEIKNTRKVDIGVKVTFRKA